MEYETHDVQETQALAQDILVQLQRLDYTHATVIALEGELGAGKTTFTQGLANLLQISGVLTSPTFVLMKQYAIPHNAHFKNLIHIDAYRLRDYHDLQSLGINDLILNKNNLIIIEWAERVKEILPEKHVTIHIDHIDETTRKFKITYEEISIN